MNHVTLLIKPASSLCNLHCQYCFYEDESENRLQKSMGMMKVATAAKLIDASFAAQSGRGSISFSFQGGEPTLAGLAFFQKFVELVNERNTRHVPIHYTIQTNAMLLDEEWATFFKAHRFLVGVSIDGSKALHDKYRVDAQGNGTFTRVTTALRLLQKTGVDVNLLCVVTRQCAANAQWVYTMLKKLGAGYLQFIPCLDPIKEPRSSKCYSLTAEAYGTFLCTLFDCWYSDWQRGRYTSIRQFDDYVHIAMGLPPRSCACSGRCGGYLVIEGDGSVYPCDFYALDEWKLGNICDNSIEELMNSKRYHTFVSESLTRPKVCATCPYVSLCHSGCRRDWVIEDAGWENFFCAAYQRFFSHAQQRIHIIAAHERIAMQLLT